MLTPLATTGGGKRVSALTRWWHQPDRFEWTTNFLRERHWLRSAQLIMAVVAGSSVLIPLSNLVSRHPITPTVTVVCAAALVFTVGMTVVWLTRWPTRRQSKAAILAGVACVAGWSITDPNTVLAALACTALAVTGGYIAFFHGPRLIVFNFGVSIAMAAVVAARLQAKAGVPTAVTAFWLIWFLNLSVPMAIWGISEAMGRYAMRSDEDPLTGLLNRRGFIDTITRHLTARQPAHTHLTVQMVDLDDFKRVNDTQGHPAGDRALTAVADLLRRHAPPSATICRAGGEEFLIAVLSGSCTEGATMASPLCTAIAGLPHGVTASIGSTCAAVGGLRPRTAPQIIAELIAAADEAMYAAKRNGGNQVQYA
jgi:diguanylate cyclase (GGDEF)-like protein